MLGIGQMPHLLVEPAGPVSIFLCPCKISHKVTADLVARASGVVAGSETDALRQLDLGDDKDGCLGMDIHIESKLLFLPNLDWAVIALVCRFSPQGDARSIPLEHLLGFNSNFRFCQGNPERQDTPTIASHHLVFQLDTGRLPSSIYEGIAVRELGGFLPPHGLRKSVTMTFGVFGQEIDDRVFYLLGTVGHPDEVVRPEWAEQVIKTQSYDRWRCLGCRFLLHSYSLTCACVLQEDKQIPVQFQKRFLDAYLKIGVRMALERALVLDSGMLLKQVSVLSQLGHLRETWTDFRRVLGVRWTAEGTQQLQIEKMWRRVSELDDRADELDRRLEQAVDFFEAEATVRLNTLVSVFQVSFFGFAAATVFAESFSDSGWKVALSWAFGMGALGSLIGWLITWRFGVLMLPKWKSILRRKRP